MSALPQGPGWWQASDGGWYPPAAEGGAAAAMPAARSTNGMAVASLVLGILWIWWIGSVLALVFGYLGKRQIRDSGGAQQGGGLATAGIVLGWIGVGVLTLLGAAVLYGMATA